MKQSNSSEILSNLQNPNIYHCICKILPLICTLNQINLSHPIPFMSIFILSSHLCLVHLVASFLQVLLPQLCTHSSSLLCMLHKHCNHYCFRQCRRHMTYLAFPKDCLNIVRMATQNIFNRLQCCIICLDLHLCCCQIVVHFQTIFQQLM